MPTIQPEQTCAYLHGHVGPWTFRHYPGKYTQKVAYYTPTNPQTPTQMNWRGIFADAIAAWKALSDEEKQIWNDKASRSRLKGTWLFRRHYLLTHPNIPSEATLGESRIGGLAYIT